MIISNCTTVTITSFKKSWLMMVRMLMISILLLLISSLTITCQSSMKKFHLMKRVNTVMVIHKPPTKRFLKRRKVDQCLHIALHTMFTVTVNPLGMNLGHLRKKRSQREAAAQSPTHQSNTTIRTVATIRMSFRIGNRIILHYTISFFSRWAKQGQSQRTSSKRVGLQVDLQPKYLFQGPFLPKSIMFT